MTGLFVARRQTARRICVLVLTLAAWPATAAAKDVALISSKTSSISALTQAELLKVCRGQMDRWPDGKPVTLVMRSPGSADLKLIEEKVYGLAPDELRELITAANHSRADRPAIIVVTKDEDVLRKVESVPGAVGMVDVYSITSAVKVVKIGGKLPLEAGYILHGN